MRYVLDSHSRIACPPESGFLSELALMSESPRSAAGFAGMGFEQTHVLKRMRVFATDFFENYARSQGKVRWADKSPVDVENAEFLAQLFPSAQFVILFRHPLDQVHSIINAELATDILGPLSGSALIEAGARNWVDQTQKLMDIAAKYPGRCHALRYEDLCGRPAETVHQPFGFLGEEWEDAVLAFASQPHDLGFEDGWVASSTGFELSTGGYVTWPKEYAPLVSRSSEL